MSAPTPFNVMGLDHVVLRVNDLERSSNFYENILGCGLERELPELGLYQYRAGRQIIDLVPVGSKLGGSNPVNQAAKNLDHFCLTISPFNENEIRAFLAGHGIECSETLERYGAEGFGRSVYVEDPDGNIVELKEGSRGMSD